MLNRVVHGVVCATMCCGLVACSSHVASEPALDSPPELTQLSLIPYEEPPPAVPSAQIGTVALSPSTYFWGDPKSLKVLAPETDDEITINEIPSSGSSALSVVIDSPVRPLRVQLTRFARVPNSAFPADGSGTSVDCEQVGQTCAVVSGDDHTTVVLGEDLGPRSFATLTVEYAAIHDYDDARGVQSYAVSWVMKSSS